VKLSEIAGQPHAVKCLQAVFAAEKIGHAYLFHGPAGTGKRTAALAFAASLNCEQRDPNGDACGACGPCREIEQEIYPELRVVVPVKDAVHDNAFHKEQMDEAVGWASRTAHSRRIKVGILEDVHVMHQAAANRFLKFLEEPPPRTVWLLLTPEPGSVLSTIRSRCQPVRFTLLPRAALDEVLTRAGHADAAASADLLLGQLDQPVDEVRAAMEVADRVLAQAARFDLGALSAMATTFNKKEEREEHLGPLLDGLERACGARLRERPQEADRWIEALDAVGRARWRRRSNMEKTLVDALGADLALALREPRRV